MNMITLLNNLITNKRGNKWNDLPYNIKDILLTNIVSISSLKQHVVDVMICLSKLGLHYNNDNNINLKNYIMDSIRQYHHYDMSKLIYTMSRINMNWCHIDDDVKHIISSSLCDQLINMNEREIVDIIYAFGKMNVQWVSLPYNTRLMLLKETERVLHDMQCPGLANVFWGLGKCNVQWNTLSMKTRTKLLDQIVILSPLDSHALTSTIKGMSKMSVTWTSLPENVRKVLELGLPSVNDNPTELVVSSLLWSLGRLKASEAILKKETKANLFDIIIYVSPTFSDQGVSSSYHGLANMKFLYHKLPMKVIRSLELPCIDKLSIMDSRAVSNIVWSLGQMNAQWNPIGIDHIEARSISDNLRTHLLKAIDRTVEKMTEQGLANTLLGLAKMNVQWMQLPVDTRNVIFKAIVQLSNRFNQQGVSNVYWALSALGVSWDSFTDNPVVLTKLCDAAVRVHKEMESQTVATCYYAIARMNAKYTDIPSRLKEALESAFIHCTSSLAEFQVSSTVYGLGKLGANFYELPKHFQVAIASTVTTHITNMDEQEVGNTLWGLGQLGIGYSAMSKMLQDNIVEAVTMNKNRLRKQALIAILHGLGKNGDVVWQLLPKQLTQTLLQSAARVCNIQSNEVYKDIRLIGNLLQMLGKLQIDWNSKDFEMSYDPVLSVSSAKAFNKELLKCFDQSFSNNKEEAGRALANSLSGIAMMQADWGRLDSDIVTILSRAIENRYHYNYLPSYLL